MTCLRPSVRLISWESARSFLSLSDLLTCAASAFFAVTCCAEDLAVVDGAPAAFAPRFDMIELGVIEREHRLAALATGLSLPVCLAGPH